MAAQFHSMQFRQFPNPGISGDLYYATDTQELFLCAGGSMFAMAGILNGGISLDSVGPQGPVGATGLAGQSFSWRGEWNTGNTYPPNDVVSYGGSVYIARVLSIHILPTNTAFWDLFAAGGAQGVQGVQGPTGATGATGPQGPAGSGGSSFTDSQIIALSIALG
jgi:hypothetical protein